MPGKESLQRKCHRNVKEGKWEASADTSKACFWSKHERSVKGSQRRTDMQALSGEKGPPLDSGFPGLLIASPARKIQVRAQRAVPLALSCPGSAALGPPRGRSRTQAPAYLGAPISLSPVPPTISSKWRPGTAPVFLSALCLQGEPWVC